MATNGRFEKNEDIEAALERVWEAFGGLKRGEFIPWREFDRVAGIGHLDQPVVYEKFVNKLLVECNIVARVQRGAGLRLLTEKERANEVLPDRLRRSRRQVNRGMRETKGAEVAGLSLHERRVFQQMQFDATRNRLMLGRAYRSQAKALKPTETNPKRKQA